MTEAGEQRPRTTAPARPRGGWQRLRPRSLATAVLEAALIGLLAATAWALIKGILEFPGVLAVAVVAGWAIGAVLWQVRATPLLAALIATGAWLLGLVLTWLVAMAILPGSTRSFLEWQAPQFGAIEVLGLALYVAAALYGARPRSG